MSPDVKNPREEFEQALDTLAGLRRFTGPPKIFWNTLIQSMAGLVSARLAVLMRKPSATETQWQKVSVWPAELVHSPGAQQFARELDTLAETSSGQEQAVHQLNGIGNSLASDCGIALRLQTDSNEEIWVAAFYLQSCTEEKADSAVRQLRLVAHIPGEYQLQKAANQNQVALSQFSSVLDLMALLNAQHRFLAVVMTFCNELAARHKCDRVSLGWLEKEYIRLQAISHTERFERKMEAVRALEQTMEEAFDQDELIVYPPPEDSSPITRDHQNFSSAHQVKFICSVPLRISGAPVAVITCERNSEPFSETEIRLLTLCCEMAARRLSELKRNDRWFGARWVTAWRELLAKAVGVQHTWAKVFTVSSAIALGVLFFGKMNYRVEAPFILRTDDIAILSAPFNGYIDAAPHQPGDPVKPKEVLLTLDTRDLHLEEAAASADLDRFTREAEKCRATNGLADMRIAQAQAEQSRVRLDLIRYHLGQSELAAPFAGVIVEGDLRKRIAAPVKQGDLLLKVADTSRMYVECDVKENDIHEIRDAGTGQIAFASQPKLKFPIQIERIEPVAQTKEQKNVFIIRCHFKSDLQNWWRPGMSGIAKLNVGKRTFFWIIAHRTIDFLRMYFWM